MIGGGIGSGIGINPWYSHETADITCNKCEHVFTIQKDDIDFYELGSEEREMGLETFYEGHFSTNCHSCQNVITLRIDASEYPPGSGVEEYDSELDGGKFVRGFVEERVELTGEIYALDIQSGLLLPNKKEAISFLRESISGLVIKINETPDLLYQLDPREFEELIANLFSENGYKVELTKKTRDGGRDIIAFSYDKMDIPLKYIIECKRYAKDRPIGVGLVRNLYGVQMQEGASKSVLVSTSKFTSEAKMFADTQNTTKWAMALKDYDDVYAWLKK